MKLISGVNDVQPDSTQAHCGVHWRTVDDYGRGAGSDEHEGEGSGRPPARPSSRLSECNTGRSVAPARWGDELRGFLPAATPWTPYGGQLPGVLRSRTPRGPFPTRDPL